MASRRIKAILASLQQRSPTGTSVYTCADDVLFRAQEVQTICITDCCKMGNALLWAKKCRTAASVRRASSAA
eukprot:2507898-Pleurochrysis_carterae.AAC.4